MFHIPRRDTVLVDRTASTGDIRQTFGVSVWLTCVIGCYFSLSVRPSLAIKVNKFERQVSPLYFPFLSEMTS